MTQDGNIWSLNTTNVELSAAEKRFEWTLLVPIALIHSMWSALKLSQITNAHLVRAYSGCQISGRVEGYLSIDPATGQR